MRDYYRIRNCFTGSLACRILAYLDCNAMKRWEAFRAMEEDGARLRTSKSSEVTYVLRDGLLFCLDEGGGRDKSIQSVNRFPLDGWEIVEETFDFAEAMKLVAAGKKVKRKGWSPHLYCESDDTVRYSDNHDPFQIQDRFITATDWIEVKS